jgi:hypothetical protein
MNTPNTINYMIAGYTVFVVVSVIYLASLVLRFRRLRKDLTSLGELEKK